MFCARSHFLIKHTGRNALYCFYSRDRSAYTMSSRRDCLYEPSIDRIKLIKNALEEYKYVFMFSSSACARRNEADCPQLQIIAYPIRCVQGPFLKRDPFTGERTLNVCLLKGYFPSAQRHFRCNQGTQNLRRLVVIAMASSRFREGSEAIFEV